MPWTRVARNAGATIRILEVDEEGRLRLDEFNRMLSRRVRLVAFSHVSNVLGLINPAKEICALAHQAGACVVIDGAQAVPHARIDVQDLGCDFYVFSGHKMLGPMATGVVWGRPELLEAMPPYHVGSNMAHEVDFERAVLEHAAQKFQAGHGRRGTCRPGGRRRISSTGSGAMPCGNDQELVRHGLARLAEIRRLRLSAPESGRNRIPVFMFVLEGQLTDGTRESSRPTRHRDSRRGHGRPTAVEAVPYRGSGAGVRLRLFHTKRHRPVG